MDDDLREHYLSIADTWLTIGNELSNKREYDEAIKAYREGLKTFPNYSPILFNLACLYDETGKFEDALGILNQYLQEYEDKFAFYKKSIILKKLNRDTEAKEVFFQAEGIGGTFEKYCIDERKKAAYLLNLKIENILEAKQSNAPERTFDIRSISDEQLLENITSFIKINHPDFEHLSIQFLIPEYFQNLGVNFDLLPIESKNRVNRVRSRVEQQLFWDLVPHRIKNLSSEEIATELIEFIKNDLAVKGKVWVLNHSRLFWNSQNINKWACPMEIQIKLKKAEGLAQEFFDNEYSEMKKAGKKSRNSTS